MSGHRTPKNHSLQVCKYPARGFEGDFLVLHVGPGGAVAELRAGLSEEPAFDGIMQEKSTGIHELLCEEQRAGADFFKRIAEVGLAEAAEDDGVRVLDGVVVRTGGNLQFHKAIVTDVGDEISGRAECLLADVFDIDFRAKAAIGGGEEIGKALFNFAAAIGIGHEDCSGLFVLKNGATQNHRADVTFLFDDCPELAARKVGASPVVAAPVEVGLGIVTIADLLANRLNALAGVVAKGDEDVDAFWLGVRAGR